MTVNGTLIDAFFLITLFEIALFSFNISSFAVLLLKLYRWAQLCGAVGPLAADLEVGSVSVSADAAVTVTITLVIILFGSSFVIPISLHNTKTLLRFRDGLA